MSVNSFKGPRLVLGIMSGTSIDAVDCALCTVSEAEVKLRRHWQMPFSAGLRSQLHAAAKGEANSWEVGQLHHDLGRFYVMAARSGLGDDRPTAVGLHGQTVFHHPRALAPATLQLGEPAWLVEALRVPVISNFRAADLAAGGQGAPLATLFHQVVFAEREAFVLVNNLGGISNVTALDWREGLTPKVMAFDTGPGNVLMDLAARHFTEGRQACDLNGALAARGRISEKLLRRFLGHAFFRRRPPKSTGREVFGEPFWQKCLAAAQDEAMSSEDVLATLTEYTARSLVMNYRLHLRGRPDRVVLAGGGAANPVLVQRITENLQRWQPGLVVQTSEAVGWPVQAIEPAAFALLAYYSLRGMPGNLPDTTGAHRPVLLGQLSLP